MEREKRIVTVLNQAGDSEQFTEVDYVPEIKVPRFDTNSDDPDILEKVRQQNVKYIQSIGGRFAGTEIINKVNAPKIVVQSENIVMPREGEYIKAIHGFFNEMRILMSEFENGLINKIRDIQQGKGY